MTVFFSDEFFLESGHTCYCDGCNLYTFDENKLSIETGWCKFLLCKHPKHSNLVLDKWHSAYVGCSYSMIRNCLDNGTLIFRGKRYFLFCSIIKLLIEIKMIKISKDFK